MNKRLNLDESNGVSVLTEALTANIKAIFADETVVVRADAATQA